MIRNIFYKSIVVVAMVMAIIVTTNSMFSDDVETTIGYNNNNYNYKRETLVKTIWCENRTSERAMRLVFSVIYNRAKEKTIDNLYNEAVKPYQFSCLNDKKIIEGQINNPKDEDMYYLAEHIVNDFVTGNFVPLTESIYYYNPKKVKRKPRHLNNKKLILSEDGHEFYL